MPENKESSGIGWIVSTVVVALIAPKILFMIWYDYFDYTLSHGLQCKDNLQRYELGGVTSGLKQGNGLIVSNRYENVNISLNGEFVFKNRLACTDGYHIRVEQQPSKQHCLVLDGSLSGSQLKSDVRSVRIICSEAG